MSDGLSRTLPNLARKPRILVCAPSNAATDELLQRIMDHGFLDFKVTYHCLLPGIAGASACYIKHLALMLSGISFCFLLMPKQAAGT